jgi:hypothetical protein
VGFLDEAAQVAMDYDYWIRAMVAGFFFHHVDQPLATYRFHPESKSCQRWQEGGDRFRQEWRIVAKRHFRRLELGERLRGYAWRAAKATKVWLSRSFRAERAQYRKSGAHNAIVHALAPDVARSDALRVLARCPAVAPSIILTRFYWGAWRRVARKR